MQHSPTAAPRWILHPALFAAAFVLEVALSNKIEPAGFARALAVAVLAGIALTLVGWAIARDRWIGGMVATAIVLATISIFPIYLVWASVRDAFGPDVALAALGLAAFVAIAAPAVQLVRARRGAGLGRHTTTLALNRFAAALVIVIAVSNVGPDLPGYVADTQRPGEKVPQVATASELPDIYVILLDGYPRADVLARKFGIDNSAFLDELKSLGLDVGTENHSNYVFTQLALASLFQMRYLDGVAGVAPLIGQPAAHANALRNAMVDSPTFAALRAAGYETITIQPGYEHASLRGAADRVLEHGETNDFERDVLKRTWLLDPLGWLIPTLITGPARDRVVHAFDDVSELAGAAHTQPTFTWVHLPAPHMPLIMDAAGVALPLDPRKDTDYANRFGMTNEEFAAAYAAELQYLNTRVLGAVRAVQAPSPHDRIIVILSDHGYTYDVEDTQARFGNLFAAFTPHDPGLLADTDTLVNLMPTLLNRYLGTDFPISADRYFLSPNQYDLLELTEIPDPDSRSSP